MNTITATVQLYANMTDWYIVVWRTNTQDDRYVNTEHFETYAEAQMFMADNVPVARECKYRFVVSPDRL